ncbi:MAG: molybdopterin molybdotransferase MoeA [Candidatus Melainabacteria bacterium]|nr:molybdopterin molybdotransferase MoeA [Candidatus Melainabacteria bacterium]
MSVKQSELTTYSEAVEIVIRQAGAARRESRREILPLANLLHRFTAEPILAGFDLPRFDNSAVDGYGVLIEDLANASESSPVRLSLTGSIQAGDSPGLAIRSGQTVKILTGAPVPPSVEAVVMREFTSESKGTVEFFTGAGVGDNIRRQGEEFKEGDQVLPAGQRIDPPVLGLIASFGHAVFPVAEAPRIAIVSTGDELVQPGTAPLAGGQIYDSNSHALRAAILALGLPEPRLYHAGDSLEETAEAFESALRDSDLVISAGGVSVGDRDFVKATLEDKLGVRTIFWRVAVKPGKPVYFGCREKDRNMKLVFGLPGNPVSVLLTFHLFVKPALLTLQGGANKARILTARLAEQVRKKPGRLDFVRGKMTSSPEGTLQAIPTRGQDSHMLSGLAAAECLLHCRQEDTLLAEGDLIDIEILDWTTY